MPRQLRKIQAFPELPRHFRKCLISANPCDTYIYIYVRILKAMFEYFILESNKFKQKSFQYNKKQFFIKS